MTKTSDQLCVCVYSNAANQCALDPLHWLRNSYKLLQTLAVTKEGVDGDDPENHILALQCHITVLPGNPTKLSLHRDDWDTVRRTIWELVKRMNGGGGGDDYRRWQPG